MKTQGRGKIIAAVVASAMLTVAVVAVLFALRFSVRHHVLHLIDPARGELPQPTTLLGPILGDAFAPGPLGWVGAVMWLLLLVAPVPLAIWSLKAQTPEDTVLRWVLSLSIHLPFVFLLALATALGLWLPFQYI